LGKCFPLAYATVTKALVKLYEKSCRKDRPTRIYTFTPQNVPA
jgi:hypothetical protein